MSTRYRSVPRVPGSRRRALMKKLSAALCVAAALATTALFAQGAGEGKGQGAPAFDPGPNRNLDARLALRSFAAVAPVADQQDAVNDLRAVMPDLRVDFDQSTGATFTLWNMGGYLTPADARDPRAIAEDFIASRTTLLGLTALDVADSELTDSVYSDITGVTHLYFRQRLNGVPVYNAQLQVNVARDGRIISVNNAYLPNLAGSVASLAPATDAVAAVARAGEHLGVKGVSTRVVSSALGRQQATELDAPAISTEPIKAQLMLLPIQKGEARLVWNFQVWTLDDDHAFDFTVDAESGQIWTRFDWVAADQYRVYRQPIESPNHGLRELAVNPRDATASPFGWHDTNGAAGAEFTTTQGNNAHAYTDVDANNVPDAGSSPDCGAGIDCDFPLDLTQAPSAYRPAAVANLFYWSNTIHDIQYRYGFNEAAGNFQENNYGRGGLGSDYVNAEAQDASGLNNANFATPPDGLNPRMQMFLWNHSAPQRDGDFDAGVIVHEYGHGISNRQVGGPGNASCLSNAQQPGEGISDWLSLVYTARLGHTGPLARGVGTYVLNQPTNGPGIRTLPYSTENSINNWTYQSITGMAIPHGVGSVWAQGMWEVYWALVDHYGWNPDLYNATGGFGNQRAMLYNNEGLKFSACSPGFTQLRDGILQAVQTIDGGADYCRVWSAFAAFGLGADAVNPSPSSTSGIVNGFDVPIACGGTANPDMSISDVSLTEGNAGTKQFGFTVSLATATASETRVSYTTADGTATSPETTLTSAGTIAVNDNVPATPYPANLVVSGLDGTIQSLAVRLNGVSHTFPGDLEVVLVGPGGQRVRLWSDAGGTTDLSNATVTFRDGAPALTAGAVTPGGTYAPTDLPPIGEDMPAPAPAAPYGSVLSVFNGTNPNGTWSLYVADDQGADSGSISSFSLLVRTTADSSDYVPTSGQLIFPPGTTSQTINVTVNGDTNFEPNETFFVNLSAPVNATLVDAQGVGTIVNDDAAPFPPPTSANDAYSTSAHAPLNQAAPGVLANDNANGAGAMTAALVSGPAHGSLTLNANGSFTYTPAANYFGTDSFTYRATTWAGSGNIATASITVNNLTTVQAPTELYVSSVVGNTVTLRWNAPVLGPTPTQYVLEGGIPAAPVLASLPTGSTAPIFTVAVPRGSWVARVHALVGAEKSAASNEVTVHAGVPVAPSAPANLLGLVNGTTLGLAWKNTFLGGAPSGLILDVTGSLTTSISLGAAESFQFTGVPDGSYTLSLRAVNGGGFSGSSNPVSVSFPGGCSGAPAPPERFLVYRLGSTAHVIWEPAASGAAPTSYVVHVSGSYVGNLPTPARRVSSPIGPGTYHVSVSAVNACGASAPTAVQTLVVP